MCCVKWLNPPLPDSGWWRCSCCNQIVPEVLHHQRLAGSSPNITEPFSTLGNSSPSTWQNMLTKCVISFQFSLTSSALCGPNHVLVAIQHHPFSHWRSLCGFFHHQDSSRSRTAIYFDRYSPVKDVILIYFWKQQSGCAVWYVPC